MVVLPIFAAVAGAVGDDKKGQRTEEAEEHLDGDGVITSAEQPTTANSECSSIVGEPTDGGGKTPTGGETVTNENQQQCHRNNIISSGGSCPLALSSSERMVSELIAAVIEQSRQRQQLQKHQQQLLVSTNKEEEANNSGGSENEAEGEERGSIWQQSKGANGTIMAEAMPNNPTTANAGGDEAQQQKEMFMRWVHQHGNNMYPSREQKERLAAQMDTSYEKVNKLFANYRRRQHKQQKVVQKSSLPSSAAASSVPMELPKRTDADGEGQTKDNMDIVNKMEDERRVTTNSWEDERERKIDETIQDIWNKVIGGGTATTSAGSDSLCDNGTVSASSACPAVPSAVAPHHSQKHRPPGRASPSLHHATGHKRKASSFTDGGWTAADEDEVPSSYAFYLASSSRGGDGIQCQCMHLPTGHFLSSIGSRYSLPLRAHPLTLCPPI
ncbi:hypothetical protein niasHT_004338 [Heterodera trifolii]|uniref:Homeobox domain-containing protein n=1 Tax=Heterodera trifolii TaxID=157864 RepID=A0ABD2LRD6_9BILA